MAINILLNVGEDCIAVLLCILFTASVDRYRQ